MLTPTASGTSLLLIYARKATAVSCSQVSRVPPSHFLFLLLTFAPDEQYRIISAAFCAALTSASSLLGGPGATWMPQTRTSRSHISPAPNCSFTARYSTDSLFVSIPTTSLDHRWTVQLPLPALPHQVLSSRMLKKVYCTPLASGDAGPNVQFAFMIVHFWDDHQTQDSTSMNIQAFIGGTCAGRVRGICRSL